MIYIYIEFVSWPSNFIQMNKWALRRSALSCRVCLLLWFLLVLFFSSRIRLFLGIHGNIQFNIKKHIRFDDVIWSSFFFCRNQQVLSVGDLVLQMVASFIQTSKKKRKIQTINCPTPTNYFSFEINNVCSVFNHTASIIPALMRDANIKSPFKRLKIHVKY